MGKIALVTDSKQPKLNVSDVKLVPEFKKVGIEAVGVPWDEVGVEWEDFEAVILRSCWNYHEHYQVFVEWLNGLMDLNIPIWNPIDIIKTNTHKSYLLELQQKGVAVVPTALIKQGEEIELEQIMETNGWETAVIKSAVSASAYNIQKFGRTEKFEGQQYLTGLMEQGDVIIQKFIPTINSGELSLVFLNKEYIFGMNKKPKRGDFRFSPRLGGKEYKIKIPADIVDQARTILSVIDSPLLYSRVDGVVEDGRFYLMELELTEPYLFFEREKSAAKRFVDAYMTLAGQYSHG